VATFSLLYTKEEAGIYAIDWNWQYRNQWTCSEKEGLNWYPVEDSSREAYQTIIEKFGLEDYREELSVEKVLAMNPLELILVRREKEKLFKLETMQVVSDTVGNHIKADNFGKTKRSTRT